MTQQLATVIHNTRAVADDGAFKRHLQSTTKGHQYLKFNDGRLSADGVPEPAGKEYLCLKMEQVGRMFHKDGGSPETCEPELIDQMNLNVPESDWPLDLNNERTAPWKQYEDIYLVDPRNGASFVFSNCTIGMKIAAEKLASQVQNMRRIRGANVLVEETFDDVPEEVIDAVIDLLDMDICVPCFDWA
jgi:hypothetical protein